MLFYIFSIILHYFTLPNIIGYCPNIVFLELLKSAAFVYGNSFATDTPPLLCNEAEQEYKLRHRKPKDNDNATTAAADSHVAHTQTSTHRNMACMYMYHASFNHRRIIVAVVSLSRKCSQVLRTHCQLILNRSLQRTSPTALPCP